MQPFPIPAFLDNYIWVLVDKEKNLFHCIDPGEAAPIQAFAQASNLQLQTILLTHHHQDHIGGVEELVTIHPDCQVYGPKDDRIPLITHKVDSSSFINLGAWQFEVLCNPGHTSSHISYYEAQQGWLFCGDTLFSAGCGRVFDGTIEQLALSMELFKKLPLNTKVFCAHEYTLNNLKYAQQVEPNNPVIKNRIQELQSQKVSCSLPSTIALEFEINPFFRTEIKEVIAYALSHGASSDNSLEVFKILRQQKNVF